MARHGAWPASQEREADLANTRLAVPGLDEGGDQRRPCYRSRNSTVQGCLPISQGLQPMPYQPPAAALGSSDWPSATVSALAELDALEEIAFGLVDLYEDRASHATGRQGVVLPGVQLSLDLDRHLEPGRRR